MHWIRKNSKFPTLLQHCIRTWDSPHGICNSRPVPTFAKPHPSHEYIGVTWYWAWRRWRPPTWIYHTHEEILRIQSISSLLRIGEYRWVPWRFSFSNIEQTQCSTERIRIGRNPKQSCYWWEGEGFETRDRRRKWGGTERCGWKLVRVGRHWVDQWIVHLGRWLVCRPCKGEQSCDSIML